MGARLLRPLLALLALGVCAVAAGGPCRLAEVAVDGQAAKVGQRVLDLGEADDPQHPTAWQGPLRITSAQGPGCEVDAAVSIIEKPLLAGDALLYVPTYSGSENHVYAVDLRTCRVVWKSPAFTGATRAEPGALILGSRRLPLDAACRPATP